MGAWDLNGVVFSCFTIIYELLTLTVDAHLVTAERGLSGYPR